MCEIDVALLCKALSDANRLKIVEMLSDGEKYGCTSCHQQYEYAKEAVKNMGLSVEVEYITDMQKVMEYGVMNMPAIVVNEKVVSCGKVLRVPAVKELLEKFI